MKKKKQSKLYEWQTRTLQGKEVCRCGNVADTVDHIVPQMLMKMFLRHEDIYEDEENLEFMCKTCNKIKNTNLDYKNPKTISLLKKYIQKLEEELKQI